MKQPYQSPTLNVVDLQLPQLFCTSINYGGEGNGVEAETNRIEYFYLEATDDGAMWE